MERMREAFYLDDEEADSIPERRSSCDDQEEKAHGRRKGSSGNSESGKEPLIKKKDHLMKISQERRLPRGS